MIKGTQEEEKEEEVLLTNLKKKKSDSNSDTLLLYDYSPQPPLQNKEEIEEVNESKSSNLTDKLKQLEEIIPFSNQEEFHPGTPTHIASFEIPHPNEPQERNEVEVEESSPFVRSSSNYKYG